MTSSESEFSGMVPIAWYDSLDVRHEVGMAVVFKTDDSTVVVVEDANVDLFEIVIRTNKGGD